MAAGESDFSHHGNSLVSTTKAQANYWKST
jgi:hypothetical protein